MMNKIALIISGVLVAISLQAQETNKFSFQFNAGTTLSMPYETNIEIWPDFQGHPSINISGRLGYFIEGLTSYGFGNQWQLSTGVNYTSYSIKVHSKAGFIEDIGVLSASYFRVPLMLGYSPKKLSSLKFSIGSYVGFNVTAEENGITSINASQIVTPEPEPVLQFNIEQPYTIDFKEVYNKVDAGLLFQLDYRVQLPKGISAVILSRFNWGLTNVVKEDYMIKYSEVWKNYSIDLGLGLQF